MTQTGVSTPNRCRKHATSFCSPCKGEIEKEKRRADIRTRGGTIRTIIRTETLPHNGSTSQGPVNAVAPQSAAEIVPVYPVMPATTTEVLTDGSITHPILGTPLVFMSPEELALKHKLSQLPLNVILTIPANRVRLFKGQPREYFDGRKLSRLAASIKKFGQREAVKVRWLPHNPHFFCELVDGQRRLLAIVRAGIATIDVKREDIPDAKTQFAISAVSNFGRAGHTPLEIARAIRRMRTDGETMQDIADGFDMTLHWAYKISKLTALAPELQELMNTVLPKGRRRLGIAVAMQLASLPSEIQLQLFEETLQENMGVIRAVPYIRRRAQELGLRTGEQNRPPKADRKILEASLQIIASRLKLIGDMTPTELREMFLHLDQEVQDRVIAVLQGVVKQAQTTQKTLQDPISVDADAAPKTSVA